MHPLKHPTFRNLFVARSISLLGTGLSSVGLALMAFQLSNKHAGIILGVALTIKMLAYLIMAPLFGAIAPYLPRKLFLVTMDGLRAALLLCMVFVTHVWETYLLMLLINTCAAGFTPIYQSMIPELIKGEQRYTKALALSRITYNIESLLSPALAAVLLMVMSYHVLFALNALAFLLSAIFVINTKINTNQLNIIGKKTTISYLSGIKEYCQNKQLIGCLILCFVASLAGATVIINSVVFFQGLFHLSETLTAIAMVVFGFGSMTFAWLIPKLRRMCKEYSIMLTGAIVIGLTNAVAVFIHDQFALLMIWFIFGVGSTAIETLTGLVINRESHATRRTALFAANFALTHGCWLVAYMLAALLGSHVSLTIYFSTLMFIALTCTFVTCLLWNKKKVSVCGSVAKNRLLW